MAEKDLGKIKKNENTDVVLRIDDFGGRPGLTIREFVTGERYTGFTKSGVKIPMADFKKFKEIVNSITDKDFESDSPAESEQENKTEKKHAPKEQKKLQEDFEDY